MPIPFWRLARGIFEKITNKDPCLAGSVPCALPGHMQLPVIICA